MQKLIVAVVIGLGVVAGLPVEAQAQATAKPQFIWNQQEREAVDAVKAWVNAWSTKDPQRVAELMADNSVFRADPAAPMKTGREAFVALITPLMPRVDSMTIDEIYVTGTEWDSGRHDQAERQDERHRRGRARRPDRDGRRLLPREEQKDHRVAGYPGLGPRTGIEVSAMKTVVSRLVLCALVVAGFAHQSAAQATGNRPPATTRRNARP